MKSKILILSLAIIFGASVFSGCSLLRKRVEKKEKTSYTLNSSGKVKIKIENITGKIKVNKSEDTLGMIKIEAEKVAEVRIDDQDKPIDGIVISIDSTGNEIKISTDYVKKEYGLFAKRDNGKVNYDIKVPANIKVDIDNTNGAIILTSLSNDINVETVNGKTELHKCNGNIKVEGINGMVIGNFDSIKALNISVTNGFVSIGGFKNVSADVSAETVHGRVKYKDLNFADLVSNKNNLKGTLNGGGNPVKITTTNGSITIDANDVTFSKDKYFGDGDFHIGFDFDNDDSKPRKKDKDAKTLEPQKGPDTPKVK